MISYNPLWKLLLDRKIKKMEFKDMIDISTTTLAKLGNDKAVSVSILEKICISLDCKIEDVVEIKKDIE